MSAYLERPRRTEQERIVELYRAGRLGLGEASGMLWMKGLAVAEAHALLTAGRGLDAATAALGRLGEKG